MRFRRLPAPAIGVIVPIYNVADYLPACLDSLLAQTYPTLDVVLVDDGSTDTSGEIADAYAARHEHMRVVHIANGGLGAARNEGMRHTDAPFVAFVDSDDVVPPQAYALMHRHLSRTGADLASGAMTRLFDDGRLAMPPWMRRMHAQRGAIVIDDNPELLGDVFAWNKLFRRSFYDAAGLSWLEGHRYEDQPTTTRAFVKARTIAVLDDVVYHWRQRADGSSITQQRGTIEDLRDRWATKQMALDTVTAYGSAKVSQVFTERVLPGDLPRYFLAIPEADDVWYDLLASGVRRFFGARSLAHSNLPPVHRLTGWLVEQGRRHDAALVMRHVQALAPGQRVARVGEAEQRRLDVPGLDPTTIDPLALALRPGEE